MKAVGIDTCVVLRLLVGEPEEQAVRAKAFIDACYYDGIDVCVSDMVVAESYHALIYHYGVPKPKAVETLRSFLSAPMITATGHAMPVVMSYNGTGAGLVDRLILSPEGYHLNDQCRLTRELFKRGTRIFTYNFHSTSLQPGCTPYIENEQQLEAFHESCRGFFRFFRDELNGVFMNHMQLHELLMGSGATAAAATRERDGVRSRQPA